MQYRTPFTVWALTPFIIEEQFMHPNLETANEPPEQLLQSI